jgi:hypothetical protein
MLAQRTTRHHLHVPVVRVQTGGRELSKRLLHPSSFFLTSLCIHTNTTTAA